MIASWEMACNFISQFAGSSPTPDRDALFTEAAQTLEAGFTQTASAATTADVSPPSPGVTSVPEATPIPPSPQPPPSQPAQNGAAPPEPLPCNRISFISDVTVPDGTVMAPGMPFTKTWRLKNEGTCTWTPDYTVVFDGGAAMGGASAVQFTGVNIPPGQAVDVSVQLVAPATPGDYRGYWNLRSSPGEVFGLGDDGAAAFWVDIRVAASGSTGSTGEAVHSSGSLELYTVVGTADLDAGVAAPTYAERDLQLNGSGVQLEPVNGGLLSLWGDNAPAKNDCMAAALGSQPVSLDDASAGKYFCYRTSEGRIGRLYVTAYARGQYLWFEFVTWEQ